MEKCPEQWGIVSLIQYTISIKHFHVDCVGHVANHSLKIVTSVCPKAYETVRKDGKKLFPKRLKL
jgi:hypothetical protein